MRERVLAIVSLIAQMVMEDQDLLNGDDLVGELLAVGFEADEIDAAFRWIENEALQPQNPGDQQLSLPTNRVFSVDEVRALSSESRGLLLRLRSMGILDDETHEEIIDRAMQMEEDEVSVKDLKTVIALTLFARSHGRWRHEVECLFEDNWSRIYH